MLRVPGRIWDIAKAVVRALAIPIEMVKANRVVAAAEIDARDFEALTDDDLGAFVQSEWTRAKDLDDKQQKLTAALSIAVTVGGLAGSTILQDLNGSWIEVAAALLFIAAALLLASGAFVAFAALQPKRRYGYGAAYLRIVAAGGSEARTEMVEAAKAFQRDNLIRSNEGAAATASIRNGVLVLALALLVSLVASATGKKPPAADPRPEVIPISGGSPQPKATSRETDASEYGMHLPPISDPT